VSEIRILIGEIVVMVEAGVIDLHMEKFEELLEKIEEKFPLIS